MQVQLCRTFSGGIQANYLYWTLLRRNPFIRKSLGSFKAHFLVFRVAALRLVIVSKLHINPQLKLWATNRSPLCGLWLILLLHFNQQLNL
jgi:hypothetical protein